MKKLYEGFSLSVSMLSIIPFFKVHNFYNGINGYAVMFYPLVGFFLGSILYIFSFTLEPFIVDTHLKIIIFFLSILITGALHLDGLVDTIDGLFVDKRRALVVMKDPHIGAMGVVFGVSFLILKASSFSSLDDLYLLPIVMMLSRLGAVFLIYKYNYINKNGMGSLAKSELKIYHVVLAFLYSFIILAIFSKLYMIVIMLIISLLLAKFFISRYGGFNGDMYGFSIEVLEIILLNSLILS